MVCGPVVLELIGAFPGADHGARFPLLVAIGVVWVLLSIMTGATGLSMIADVVDARAVDVGRREEGLVMATVSFVSKVASGMGVWLGGLVLTVVAFPGAGEMDTIDAAVIERLGWWYAPLLTFVYAAAIMALYFYQLDRATHREHIEALGRRAEAAFGCRPRPVCSQAMVGEGATAAGLTTRSATRPCAPVPWPQTRRGTCHSHTEVRRSV